MSASERWKKNKSRTEDIAKDDQVKSEPANNCWLFHDNSPF